MLKGSGEKIEEVNNRSAELDNENQEPSKEAVGQVSGPESLSKEQLMEALRQVEEKTQKHYDLYLRSLAEMENLKKRSAKEKEEWLKYANESLIKNILPVMDNLEKAITHSHEGSSLHALREGVELTLKGLKDALEKSGLKEIEALGVPFDPCFHEAVSQIPSEEMETGVVLQELQKGYTLNGRLVRPSMVVVSAGKGSSESEKASCKAS